MLNILSICIYLIACALIIAASVPHKQSYVVPLILTAIALITIIILQIYSLNSVIYTKAGAGILAVHLFVTIKEIFTKL
tara:strand:- start:368 stop:604 length:237 start_codon:yes stop_codon:yes gene_type:complete